MIAAVGVILGRRVGLDATGWAAWVQAVGSVAAILVAIAVANVQSASERFARIEEQRKLGSLITLAIRNLAFAAYGVKAHALKHPLDTAFAGRFSAYIQQRENPVLAIPLWSITDQELAVEVLTLQAAIGDTRQVLEELPGKLPECLDQTLQHLPPILAEIWRSC